jgi:hypothetical protein
MMMMMMIIIIIKACGEADYSPPCSAKVKTAGSSASTPPEA